MCNFCICTNSVRQFLFQDNHLALHLETFAKYSVRLFHVDSSVFDKLIVKVAKPRRKARLFGADSVGY